MTFSAVPVGEYFTMSKGLLWRKLNNAEAADVWSGRIIRVKPTTKCNVLSKEKKYDVVVRTAICVCFDTIYLLSCIFCILHYRAFCIKDSQT